MPESAVVARLMFLQRAAGNAAVTAMLRPADHRTKPQKIVASPEGATQEGHSALAKAGAGRPGHVYWAGTATFDDGVLKTWTNDSGHYKPTGEDAPRVAGFTGGPFSMDKYRDHAAG
ncbi:hypothetical protein [Streptomyces rimosus]|uniref:hypothetical protein n=1 Tax=Streptomyces rimosus TaxID=1927 RepID=UPI0004BFAD7E|nr:hypothetical protein [Streptomyces rimosus]